MYILDVVPSIVSSQSMQHQATWGPVSIRTWDLGPLSRYGVDMVIMGILARAKMRRTQEGESKAAHLAYSIAASTDLFDKSGPAVYYQNVFLNNAGSAEESASGAASL